MLGDLQNGSGYNGDARKRKPQQLQKGEKTALQKHVAFFDRDGDGVIWPQDTFIGEFVALALIRTGPDAPTSQDSTPWDMA